MPTLEKAKQRRYGFEIENSQFPQMADQLEDAGFELSHDSSVQFDCYCSCSDCNHDCNCENCDIANYGVRHCENETSCSGNEISTPTLFEEHLPIDMRQALEDIGRYTDRYAQTDDACGMHIHIEARDLSVSQIGLVIKLWDKVVHLDPDAEFRGRTANHYCELNSPENVHYNDRRQLQVNIINLMDFARGINQYEQIKNRNPYGRTTDTHKSTIEFRGFAPIYDYDTVMERVNFCRHLVEYAAKGLPPYWLLRAKSLEEFQRELMR